MHLKTIWTLSHVVVSKPSDIENIRSNPKGQEARISILWKYALYVEATDRFSSIQIQFNEKTIF